nr:protein DETOXIFICATION 29-like [Tanacetum cinerariifolium]
MLVGMGSALETLCGQAFGAGQVDMLGIYMQRSWVIFGTCGRAWSGFSWAAFSNLWGFVKLSLASAVMLCLETWYFMALILFAGYLKNAEIAVDALSVCTNIVGWAVMIAIGFNAAISVRVSNELGAAHPRAAKFSIVVVVAFSIVVGAILSLLLVIFRHQYPALFADSLEVQEAVYTLTPLLALCLVINNIQPALSGVAIGAGWQAAIAYINIACYYIFGVPLGLTLGFAANWGVKGIWIGMLTGTVVQTIILIWICCRTNWDKEASMAEKRIKQWSGKKQVEGEQ